mgnify:CR=1 FL=1
MKLRDIAELLNAKIVCGESRLDEDFRYAFSSDLMSDVLTLEEHNPIILSGLCNIQTIRTCEMGCLSAIIFVRKKKKSYLCGAFGSPCLVSLQREEATELRWERGEIPRHYPML